jgi:hypothetical protein
MSQIASIDTRIIDLLTASYGKPIDFGNVVVNKAPTNSSRSRVKVSSTSDNVARIEAVSASIGSQSSVVVGTDRRSAEKVAPLPTSGSVDGHTFFVMMRHAKNRDESISCIAAYVGYDRNVDYGSQELAARLKATREVNASKPIIASTAIRGSSPATANGMVAYNPSLPNESAKKLAALEARANMVGESIADHEAIANGTDADLEDKHYHAQLAVIDRARLATIRQDIAHLRSTM